jgi:hypothetical protein
MSLKGCLLFTVIFILNSNSIFGQVIIQKFSDLNFGEVFIGYSSIVADTSPDALKISFYHTSTTRQDFLITLSLPSTLTNGIDNLPINFNNYAAWSKTDAITGRTYFNPYSPLLIRRIKTNQRIYLWLGGQILSSSSITPGEYSGTIIITIEVI